MTAETYISFIYCYFVVYAIEWSFKWHLLGFSKAFRKAHQTLPMAIILLILQPENWGNCLIFFLPILFECISRVKESRFMETVKEKVKN